MDVTESGEGKIAKIKLLTQSMQEILSSTNNNNNSPTTTPNQQQSTPTNTSTTTTRINHVLLPPPPKSQQPSRRRSGVCSKPKHWGVSHANVIWSGVNVGSVNRKKVKAFWVE
jgi:hypothetical protein